MKRKYNLSHRLVACILLMALFLQSCGSFSNTLIPKEKESTDTIRESTKRIDIQQLLVEQKLISAGWEVTDLYEEQDELKVKAIERHGNFTSKPHELSVSIAPDIDIEQVYRLSPTEQERLVHFNPPQNNQLGRVLVSKEGLLGGMASKDTRVEQTSKNVKEAPSEKGGESKKKKTRNRKRKKSNNNKGIEGQESSKQQGKEKEKEKESEELLENTAKIAGTRLI